MEVTLQECLDDVYTLLADVDIKLGTKNPQMLICVVTPGSDVFLEIDGAKASLRPTGARFFNRRFDQLSSFFAKEFPPNHEAISYLNSSTMKELMSRIQSIVPFAVVTTDVVKAASAIRQCYLSGDRGIEPLLVTEHIVWMMGHRM